MANKIRVYNVVNNFHMFEDHIYHDKCCIKDWPMMIQNVFPFAILLICHSLIWNSNRVYQYFYFIVKKLKF